MNVDLTAYTPAQLAAWIPNACSDLDVVNTSDPYSVDFQTKIGPLIQALRGLIATTNNRIVYKAADYSILAADSGIQFSVSGGGIVTLTLPTGIALPAGGVPQRNRFFVPRDGSTLVVKAPGTDIIEFGALATAAGGNLTSAVYGCAFELVNTEANRWLCIAESATNPTVN